MHTLATGDHRAGGVALSLHGQSDDLEMLHREWRQQVEAWRLAHDIVVEDASALLNRMDAMIRALEAL